MLWDGMLNWHNKNSKVKYLEKSSYTLTQQHGCQPHSARYLSHFTVEVKLINQALNQREGNRITSKTGRLDRKIFELNKNILGGRKEIHELARECQIKQTKDNMVLEMHPEACRKNYHNIRD